MKSHTFQSTRRLRMHMYCKATNYLYVNNMSVPTRHPRHRGPTAAHYEWTPYDTVIRNNELPLGR